MISRKSILPPSKTFYLDRRIETDYLNNPDEHYSYDDLGNRLTLNTRGVQDVAYSHNAANDYTSIDDQFVSHDEAGNLVMDQRGYQYQYDHDNRLIKITQDSTDIAAFTYDALGRRIEKIEYDTTNITTRYYYDGWRVLSETNAAGTKQRHYVYGNYLDEALMLIHDDGEASPTYTDYYYAHNHLYSPVALINASGTVVERYEYNVYGKPYFYNSTLTALLDPQKSTKNNPVMFTGQRFDRLDDGDLQLMYYKNQGHLQF